MENEQGDEIDKTIVSYLKELNKYIEVLERSTTKVTAIIMKLLRHYNANTKDSMDKPLEDIIRKLSNNCKYLNNTKNHIKERQEEI